MSEDKLAQAPKIHPIAQAKLAEAVQHQLSNGIVINEIRLGTQAITRFELIFEAGRWYEPAPLAARAMAKLLKSGTRSKSAEEISDFFAYYGAKLTINDGFDTTLIRLSCLSKHFETLLPVLIELLTEATFPEEELQKFIRRCQQKLKVQLKQNELIAYREFTEVLYSSEHPYGYNSTHDLYNQIDSKILKSFWQQSFTAQNCRIILAGNPPLNAIELIDKAVSTLPKGTKAPMVQHSPLPTVNRQVFHIPSPKQKANQASIRIGRRLFPRSHPDFHVFSIANTLLGGYFGARLMQNLREDKGYTYGIYSAVDVLRHDSFFHISTDVGAKVRDAAIKEIYTEIERLCDEPVPEEELMMVKRYLMGSLLSALDGVLAIASVNRELLDLDSPSHYFEQYIHTINTITATDIQKITQKYLQKDFLTEVVVG